MSNNIFFHGINIDHRTEIVFRVLMVTVAGLILGAMLRTTGLSESIEASGVFWYMWAGAAVVFLFVVHIYSIRAFNNRLFSVERSLIDVLKTTGFSNGIIDGVYVNGYNIKDGCLYLEDNVRHATTRCMWMLCLATAFYIAVIPQTNVVYAALMVGVGAILNGAFFSNLIRFITFKCVNA